MPELSSSMRATLDTRSATDVANHVVTSASGSTPTSEISDCSSDVRAAKTTSSSLATVVCRSMRSSSRWPTWSGETHLEIQSIDSTRGGGRRGGGGTRRLHGGASAEVARALDIARGFATPSEERVDVEREIENQVRAEVSELTGMDVASQQRGKLEGIWKMVSSPSTTAARGPRIAFPHYLIMAPTTSLTLMFLAVVRLPRH